MADDPKPTKKASQDYAAERDWPGYFQTVLGKPARETLVKALELFEKEGAAPGTCVDLGCGEGRDTLELLKRGWRVIAIDDHPAAFELLLGRVPGGARLETRRESFHGLTLPTCDLVNASFSLPFCAPEHFGALWRTIVGAVRPGGRFAGQLFGDRHSWAALPDRSHQTRSEVERMFEEFELEMFQEEERDSASSSGEMLHWHLFHVVGRKR